MATCGFNEAPYNMGMGFGLEDDRAEIVRKFRWLFKIKGISAQDDTTTGMLALPPYRASRPGLTWKEESYQHLTETISYPVKPEFKSINLILYDVKRCSSSGIVGASQCSPVYTWIVKNSQTNGPGFYNPQTATVTPIVEGGFKRPASLEMLDGCGNIIEEWNFDNCWPQNVEWGELEMSINDYVTIDITLKFDRAYLVNCSSDNVS